VHPEIKLGELDPMLRRFLNAINGLSKSNRQIILNNAVCLANELAKQK
jgi:hypothetical protein